MHIFLKALLIKETSLSLSRTLNNGVSYYRVAAFLQTSGKVLYFVRSSSFRQLDKSVEDIRIRVYPAVIMDALVQQFLSETLNIACDL